MMHTKNVQHKFVKLAHMQTALLMYDKSMEVIDYVYSEINTSLKKPECTRSWAEVEEIG